MRICIAGAGAIGGFMGARLSAAGETVTLVTLGEHLEAIKARGLHIQGLDGEVHRFGDFHATDRFDEAGSQDLVILAVKANQIEGVAPDLPATYSRHTGVMTVQNGIPWWYFQRSKLPMAGGAINFQDPSGVIASNIPPERIVGCVAYPAVEYLAPGVLRHVEGVRFPVGELDGSESGRVKAIASLLTRAGFKAPVLADIRNEIWLKALGALAFNPISALTHASLVDICRCRETRELARRMMEEAEEIARRLGVSLRLPIERRIAGAEAVGNHKTSMLQDVEIGRPIELEALLGGVIQLGEMTGAPTANLEAVYACTRLLADTLTGRHSRLRLEVAGEDGDATAQSGGLAVQEA